MNKLALLLVVVSGIFGVLLWVPFTPDFSTGFGLDPSWEAVLAWAFKNRVVHGRDVCFTFGPWGILYNARYFGDGIYVTRMLMRAGCAAGVSVAWFALCRRCRFPVPMACLGFLFLMSTAQWVESLFMVLPVIAVLLTQTRDSESAPRSIDWPLVALMGSMAVGGLMKFSFMIGGIAAVVAITVLNVRRRARPTALVAFAGSIVVLWLAAGQPVTALPIWFFRSLQVASGYDAMGVPGGISVREPWLDSMRSVQLFVVAATGCLAMIALSPVGMRRLTRLALVSTVGFVLFLSMKGGLVRHDGRHETGMWRGLVAISVGLLPLAFQRSALLRRRQPVEGGGRRRTGWLLERALATQCFAVGTVAFGVYHLASNFQRVYQTNYLLYAFASGDRLWTGVRDVQGLISDREVNQRESARVKGDILAKARLPRFDGTVDQMGFSIIPLLLAGEHYAPRPVFQSYVAYTTPLQELNAAYLRSAKAPDTLLYSAESIDDRFPTQDDALAYLEMLRRYEPRRLIESSVTAGMGRFLELRRTSASRDVELVPLKTVSARFNSDIEVPDAGGDPVWVSLSVEPTVGGRIKSALLRPPLLQLQVKQGQASNIVKTFRLVPATLKSGFLLSPTVENPFDFMRLYDRSLRSSSRRVRSIRLQLGAGAQVRDWYHRQFKVTFSRVAISSGRSEGAGSQDATPAQGLQVGAKPALTPRAGSLVNDLGGIRELLALEDGVQDDAQFPPRFMPAEEDGILAVNAHPLCSTRLDVPKGVNALTTSYGFIPSGFLVAAPTRFSIVGVGKDGVRKVLWEDVVDTMTRPEQRRRLAAEVTIPPGTAWLNFRTEPAAGRNTNGWAAYWTEVHLGK